MNNVIDKKQTKKERNSSKRVELCCIDISDEF